MTLKVLALLAVLLAPATVAFSQTDRTADAAAIRAHIESIFQAFIDGDVEKIFATHSEDWRGLLEGTSTPIKGIDEYMRANGIDWPRPKDAPDRPTLSPPPPAFFRLNSGILSPSALSTSYFLP